MGSFPNEADFIVSIRRGYHTGLQFMELGISELQCPYLDLGTNHAQQLSNAYCFSQKGSRGVLVETNPKLIAELKFYRSGDVILNRYIAGESGQSVDFYIMSGEKNQRILQLMAGRDYVKHAFAGISSILGDKKQMKDLGVLK